MSRRRFTIADIQGSDPDFKARWLATINSDSRKQALCRVNAARRRRRLPSARPGARIRRGQSEITACGSKTTRKSSGTTMTEILLPNKWCPRPHQQKLWSYLDAGGKRSIEIAHRHWGKDDVALHWTAVAAMQRPASYWCMLPNHSQARKAIWTAVNPHTGKRRIDEPFPAKIRS
jgi:hypothetical protein